jgi:hypothetical protein
MLRECLVVVQYMIKSLDGTASFHLNLCSCGRPFLAAKTFLLLDLSMDLHPSARLPQVCRFHIPR